MENIGWLKRALPFLATFAIGIFVASFFVNIGAPRFGNRSKYRHEVRELRIENELLREENQRLLEQQSQMLELPAPPAYLENEGLECQKAVEQPVLPPPPPMPVKPRSVHAK